jgi:hypothetical protein
MYLIGLQALNAEHVFMGKAVYQTRTLPAQIQIKGAIVDCLLLKCKSKEDEQLVKQHFALWTWHDDEPIARVKNIKDSTHIELKEHEVQKKTSSWVPTCNDDDDDVMVVMDTAAVVGAEAAVGAEEERAEAAAAAAAVEVRLA